MGVFDFLSGGNRQDRFAHKVMAHLQARGWPRDMRYDRERSKITIESIKSVISLGEPYRDWLTYPLWKRRERLDHYLEALSDPNPFDPGVDNSYPSIGPLLLPVVSSREQMDVDGFESMSQAGIVGTLADVLAVYVAVQRPNRSKVATGDELVEWGLPSADILRVAIDNLQARGVGRLERAPAGFFVFNRRDDYNAARLLTPQLFRALPLQGKPVAVAMSRSCLVVAGSEEVDGLNSMADFVHDFIDQEDDPVSYAPLILVDDAWRPFEPATKALAAIRALTAKQRLWDYSTQCPLLQERLDRTSASWFVAPLEAIGDGDELRTWTTWAKGAPTMLPRADTIGLYDSAEVNIMRRWEDVEAVCGPFAVDDSTYPPRFRAEQWLTAEAWDRLKTAFDQPSWIKIKA